MIRIFWLLCVASLAGCVTTTERVITPEKAEPDNPLTHEKVIVENDPCLVDSRHEDFIGNCDIWYWIDIWLKADALPWEERKPLIAALGDDIPATFKKVLLSQPIDTPYKDRLRAQHWLTELKPSLTPAMTRLITVIIEKPSNQMLEFESAITMLSRVNGRQEASIEEMQKRLEEQRKQLQALLNIEETLMDKNGGEQP